MKDQRINFDFAGNGPALDALNLTVNSKHSIHLSGHTGTGKTTLINKIKQAKFAMNKSVVVLAPDWHSANRIKGVSISRFFNLQDKGITSVLPEKLDKVKHSWDDLVFIRNLDLIIIYKVENVSGQLLDIMDYMLRKIRGNTLPFGNIQVLTVGDHFNCAPHALKDFNGNDVEGTNFFSSRSFQSLNMLHICLRKCYANIDPLHLEILNGIRTKRKCLKYFKILNEIVEKNRNKQTKRIRVTKRLSTAQWINENGIKESILNRITDRGRIELNFQVYAREIKRLKRCFFAGEDGDYFTYRYSQIVFLEDAEDGSYKKGDIGIVTRGGGFGCELDLSTLHVKLRWKRQNGYLIPPPVRVCQAIYISECIDVKLEYVEFELEENEIHGKAHIALAMCRSLKSLTFSRPLNLNDVTSPDPIFAFDEIVKSSKAANLVERALSDI